MIGTTKSRIFASVFLAVRDYNNGLKSKEKAKKEILKAFNLATVSNFKTNEIELINSYLKFFI
jgi:hypothetical protein